jgi:AbrB family looped-hinge helix DNA binding protein
MKSVLDKQGRITIPKPICDHLHLKPGDRIKFFIENGVVYLRPVRTGRPQ